MDPSTSIPHSPLSHTNTPFSPKEASVDPMAVSPHISSNFWKQQGSQHPQVKTHPTGKQSQPELATRSSLEIVHEHDEYVLEQVLWVHR